MTQNKSSAVIPTRKPFFTTLIVAVIFYIIAMTVEDDAFEPFYLFSGIIFIAAIYNRLKDLNYPRVLTVIGALPGLNILMVLLLAQRLTRNDESLIAPSSSKKANFSLGSFINHYVPQELKGNAFNPPEINLWPDKKEKASKSWVDKNDRYARPIIPKTATASKNKSSTTQTVYKKTDVVIRHTVSPDVPTINRSRRDK